MKFDDAPGKCSAIMKEINKYDEHLNSSAANNKKDSFQKVQIEEKQKVVVELKDIMNSADLNDNAKLTALISKLNETLSSGASTIEFLSSSRKREGFGASIFTYLPVKGNKFKEALEKILGQPLASFDLQVRKYDR